MLGPDKSQYSMFPIHPMFQCKESIKSILISIWYTFFKHSVLEVYSDEKLSFNIFTLTNNCDLISHKFIKVFFTRTLQIFSL